MLPLKSKEDKKLNICYICTKSYCGVHLDNPRPFWPFPPIYIVAASLRHLGLASVSAQSVHWVHTKWMCHIRQHTQCWHTFMYKMACRSGYFVWEHSPTANNTVAITRQHLSSKVGLESRPNIAVVSQE